MAPGMPGVALGPVLPPVEALPGTFPFFSILGVLGEKGGNSLPIRLPGVWNTTAFL